MSAKPDGKTCFLVCPIGDDGSAVRRRSDLWAKFIVAPVVAEFGYRPPVRADSLGKPGYITSQIIEAIRDSDLVIADLTESNANVFYELALRHVSYKPVVQFRAPDVLPPFDVGGLRAIGYNIDDLESVDAAKTDLRKALEAVAADPEKVGSDNPVGGAIRISELAASGESEKEALAHVLDEIAELKALLTSAPRVVFPVVAPAQALSLGRAEPAAYVGEVSPVLGSSTGDRLSEATLAALVEQLQNLRPDDDDGPTTGA